MAVVFVLGLTVVFLGRLTSSTKPINEATSSITQTPSIQTTDSIAYPLPSEITPLPTIIVATADPAKPFPVYTPVPSPLPLPPLEPNDPYIVSVFAEPDVTDPKILAEYAPQIIIGKVVEISPARWSTSDGSRPKNPFDPSNQMFIYTPVRIKVLQYLKGLPSQEDLVLHVPGGVIGKDEAVYLPEELYKFSKDEDVVVFFGEGKTQLNTDRLDLFDHYTITLEGEAKNAWQVLPVEDLLSIIQDVVKPK